MVQRGSKTLFWVKIVAAVCAALLFFLCLLINFAFPVKFSSIVGRESSNFNIKPQLIYAVIWTESRFDSSAVSSAGAVGLMQLLPSTAAFCAEALGEEFSPERLTDPSLNIRLGTFYLRYLTDKFGEYGQAAVVAAYNAGEGNLTKWLQTNGEIEFPETRLYVKKVMLSQKVYTLKT